LCTSAKKTVSKICSQEETACFTLASAANRIPARSYLRGLNRKTLGPILSNRFETGYGARIGEVIDDPLPSCSAGLTPSDLYWIFP
jgi:hypothetical protein